MTLYIKKRSCRIHSTISSSNSKRQQAILHHTLKIKTETSYETSVSRQNCCVLSLANHSSTLMMETEKIPSKCWQHVPKYTASHPSMTCLNLLKPTGHVMHQQFNIQQLYVLPTLYLCVLYLSENKQRLVQLTA